MKRKLLPVLMALSFSIIGAAKTTENPAAVTALLTRVTGAADRFETVVDDELATTAQDVFVITSKNGKPCIKGSTLTAVTTGINWYLNHYAHVNIAWNNLTTDLSSATLPLPAADEQHEASVEYRYYLNYCTFSYSMSTWTWERWQQEIDWMALHGVNMPLQIVGLDVVWQKLLTQDLGYSTTEANDFIAGPCFQAWWGMNNLQGWGGPNPDWWYTRQETLCKQILARERELGMEPVLPGYAGMVPSDIGNKGYTGLNQGGWCGFTRPYILDPNSEAFATISAKYYQRLNEVMGQSRYYSMDPFHEGANTSGIDVPSAYSKIAEAMTTANPDGKWVIQFWQWSSEQYNVLDQVEKGKLIVLDLFSEAHTHFNAYKGHEAVYCMLANFGGRTGFFGRLSKVMKEFFSNKAQYSNIKGIGATSEAIEQVPVLYDALYELPWYSSAPDPATWVKDYATARYGTENADAADAWERLRTSSLNCESQLQGPMEAVVCARPSLNVSAVSSWGGTEIFYDAQEVVRAAALLAASGLSGENYDYDVTDLTRQALTDYANYLLKAINSAANNGDTEAYQQRRDKYLALILDLDRLLCTNRNFMVGNWTQLARGIADEADGTTESDRQWLELNNARTLITTWGERTQSESGGLRDYSYREWGGIMKDFYYTRWKTFFDNRDANTAQPDWFTHDWQWAHDASLSYSNTPEGSTKEVAAELFDRYFARYQSTDGTLYYLYRGIEQDYNDIVTANAYRGETFTPEGLTLPADATATLCIDYNNDGTYSADETTEGLTATIPTTAVAGQVKACLKLSDGTAMNFTIALRDRVTTPRTVTVAIDDAEAGSVSIDGAEGSSLTGTDDVVVRATANVGYEFLNWTDANGNVIGNNNPYTYYGAADATFTAHFIVNKWGTPTEDYTDLSTVQSYEQYVAQMSITQNGGDATTIYSASCCPSTYFHLTDIVNAAKGSSFKIAWNGTDKNGLNYCRLSAYIDLNSDGDFDDEGEFLAVIGTKNSAGNSAVSNGTLTVLLPYDIPTGLTHMRLRYDGAWSGGWDSTTDAKPANATAARMVYDIPINFTEYAATACTVTVVTSDTKKGTVDANGQDDTYTYGVGEDVILRAYPSEGYVIDSWTDSYGRPVPASWQDGNLLRFKAPESGTYTAQFVSDKLLTCGDWTLRYDDSDGLTLTGVVSGKGALDLSATNSLGKDITRLLPTLLRGNKDLTTLTLPASLTSYDTYLDVNFKGAGEDNALITPATPLPAAAPWALHLAATNSGVSYNTWGSGLLATGTDALGTTYTNGFQLYLKAAGTLTVKVGTTEYAFTNTLGSTFSIDMAYDGEGTLTITTTAADGQQETKTIAQTLTAITTFATALPAGIDITRLVIDDPWLHNAPLSGCTALTDITVASGSPLFTSTDGLLYDAKGAQLVAYPEGRLTRRAYRLLTTDATPQAISAAPNANADGSAVIADDARGALVETAGATAQPAELWTLVAQGEGYRVKHLNSQRYFGSASVGGDIQLPIDPDNWYGTYYYTLPLPAAAPAIALYDATPLYATATDGKVTLNSAATTWTLQEVKSLPVALNALGWAAVCLPVDVIVPESSVATLAVATSINSATLSLTALAPGSMLPAGTGFLVKGESNSTITLAIATDATTTTDSALASNLLSGATLRRTAVGERTFYALGEESGTAVLSLSELAAVPANTAYYLQSRTPDLDADYLLLDSTTGLSGLPTTTPAAADKLYDLQGRRVKTPRRGLYISERGHKVIR